MGDRLSKITTRTGDQVSTGLADGSRRSKHDQRIVCMGGVDELNACIGLASSQIGDGELRDQLHRVQHDLFAVGAALCQPGKRLIDAGYIEALESSAEAPA